jgi:hypothetical protein
MFRSEYRHENLDLTSTCIDLSWTDARAAEDLIRMIILSHTDDKMTLSLKKCNRVKALPTMPQITGREGNRKTWYE